MNVWKWNNNVNSKLTGFTITEKETLLISGKNYINKR